MSNRVERGDRVSWFVPWLGWSNGTVTGVTGEGVAVVKCESHEEMGLVVAVSKLELMR